MLSHMESDPWMPPLTHAKAVGVRRGTQWQRKKSPLSLMEPEKQSWHNHVVCCKLWNCAKVVVAVAFKVQGVQALFLPCIDCVSCTYPCNACGLWSAGFLCMFIKNCVLHAGRSFRVFLFSQQAFLAPMPRSSNNV